jgi:nitrogenase molybdenum-iron protein NifN
VGNVFMAHLPHHGPGDWPLPPLSLAAAQGHAATALPAVAHLPAEIPRAGRPADPHALAQASA